MQNFIKTTILIGGLATSLAALADDYPSKPIRLIVPFAAGGNSDALARILADRMGRNMKQSIIVEAKVRAGGSVGTPEVAKAAPDGYTILLGTSSTHAINPAVYSKLPYDAVKNFAPVTTLALSDYALVVPGTSPYKTMAELLKGSASNQLKYASNGSGTTSHLASALLAMKVGTEFLHIPYNSSSPAMPDLMGARSTS